MKLEYVAIMLLLIILIFVSYFSEDLDAFDPDRPGILVYREQTQYQTIEIQKIPGYGKALVLNGEFQLSESDESFYHEALVHPAIFTSDDPKKILILGGGDGGAAKEVLKHDINVTLVDLDKRVVNISQEYFSFSKEAFSNPKLTLNISEGRSFLSETNESFDIIFIDLPDPTTNSVALLYTKEFYELVKKRCNNECIVVTQAESPFFFPKAFSSISKTMDSVFYETYPYHTWVPIFGDWGFVMSCNYDCDPFSDSVIERVQESQLKMEHYNSDFHKSLFLLDKRTRNILNDSQIKINDDEHLVLVQYSTFPVFR